MEYCLAYITSPNLEEARKLGKTLIERKLCACVNILENMTSIYSWEGKIEEGKEVVMIAKTKSELFESLSKAVGELHSYEVPCVLEIPLGKLSGGYEKWLENSLK